MNRHSMRRKAATVLLSLLLLIPAARVCDAKETVEATRRVHIEAQPLSSAIGKICEQTGLLPYYLSPPRWTEKIMVNAVDGNYTPTVALQKITANTGVELEIVGGIYIGPRMRLNWKPAEPAALAPVELVAANVPIPEVLVKGSRSSNVAILPGEAGTAAMIVFKHEQLERSGARTVGQFLHGMLTANVVTSPASGVARISSGRPIDLFGLSPSDTSVTIDGNLPAGLATGGLAQQVDLETLDLALVERIEVMQGTATAVGGNGGTAGRINIVSRAPIAGTLVNMRSAQMPNIGASSRDVSLASGIGDREAKGSLSFKASWSVQEAIQAAQHNTISSGAERVAMNNPDRIATAYPPLSADRNTRSLTGAALPGLDSSYVFIPANFTGTVADLQANAGQFSYRLAPTGEEKGGGKATLLPSRDVKTFEIAAGRDFPAGFSLDAGLGGARSVRSGLVSVIEEKIPRTLLLPPLSPGNPFAVPVLQTVANDLGDGTMTAQQDTRFAHAAIKSSLFGTGVFRLGYSYYTLDASFTRPMLSESTSGLMLSTGRTRPYESSAQEATALATMPVFGRARGTGYLNLSASHRVEHMADASSIGSTVGVGSSSISVPRGSQVSTGLQAQVAVPFWLWDGDRADPLLQTDLSVRGDRYRIATDQMAALGREPVTFHKATGQLSVSFKPVFWGAVRAGASTGFRPAPLTLLSPSAEQHVASLPVPDPLRPGELLGPVTLVYGGSFELRPETARTFKAGLVLTPALNDDLRISMDYLWIRKRDVILGPEDLFFANPAAYLSQFWWRVSRQSTTDGSAGAVYRIDSTSLNISQLDVKALDLGLNWRTRAGSLGTFELVTNATVAPSFVRKLTPDSAAVDESGIGTLSAPRYRLSAMGVFSGGPLEVGLAGRLTSKTRVSLDENVIADQGGRTVGRQGYLDLFVSYTTSMPSLGDTKLRIRFDANNVLRRGGEFNAAAPRYVDRFGEDELPSLALSFSIQSAS